MCGKRGGPGDERSGQQVSDLNYPLAISASFPDAAGKHAHTGWGGMTSYRGCTRLHCGKYRLLACVHVYCMYICRVYHIIKINVSAACVCICKYFCACEQSEEFSTVWTISVLQQSILKMRVLFIVSNSVSLVRHTSGNMGPTQRDRQTHTHTPHTHTHNRKDFRTCHL